MTFDLASEVNDIKKEIRQIREILEEALKILKEYWDRKLHRSHRKKGKED